LIIYVIAISIDVKAERYSLYLFPRIINIKVKLTMLVDIKLLNKPLPPKSGHMRVALIAKPIDQEETLNKY